MALLLNFDKEQLLGVSKLLNDDDFKNLVKYLVRNVTEISNMVMKTEGVESERLKGACLAIQELRDQILTSRDVFDALLEKEELEALGSRDIVSP